MRAVGAWLDTFVVRPFGAFSCTLTLALGLVPANYLYPSSPFLPWKGFASWRFYGGHPSALLGTKEGDKKDRSCGRRGDNSFPALPCLAGWEGAEEKCYEVEYSVAIFVCFAFFSLGISLSSDFSDDAGFVKGPPVTRNHGKSWVVNRAARLNVFRSLPSGDIIEVAPATTFYKALLLHLRSTSQKVSSHNQPVVMT